MKKEAATYKMKYLNKCKLIQQDLTPLQAPAAKQMEPQILAFL